MKGNVVVVEIPKPMYSSPHMSRFVPDEELSRLLYMYAAEEYARVTATEFDAEWARRTKADYLLLGCPQGFASDLVRAAAYHSKHWDERHERLGIREG